MQLEEEKKNTHKKSTDVCKGLLYLLLSQRWLDMTMIEMKAEAVDTERKYSNSETWLNQGRMEQRVWYGWRCKDKKRDKDKTNTAKMIKACLELKYAASIY